MTLISSNTCPTWTRPPSDFHALATNMSNSLLFCQKTSNLIDLVQHGRTERSGLKLTSNLLTVYVWDVKHSETVVRVTHLRTLNDFNRLIIDSFNYPTNYRQQSRSNATVKILSYALSVCKSNTAPWSCPRACMLNSAVLLICASVQPSRRLFHAYITLRKSTCVCVCSRVHGRKRFSNHQNKSRKTDRLDGTSFVIPTDYLYRAASPMTTKRSF